MRHLTFGRYGLKENPVGLTITWGQEPRGDRIARVTGVKRKHIVAGDYDTFLLETRFFCGDKGPDVPAREARVLEEEGE